MSSITTRDAVRQFIAWAKETLSESSVKGYARWLDRFVSKHGRTPLAELTPALVASWSRRWHCQQAVQRLTSWAAKLARLVSPDPLEGMRLPKRGKRQRVAERAELVRLMRSCERPLRRILRALIETMARPHEMRIVRWEMIRRVGNQAASVEDLLAGRAFFLLHKFKGQGERLDDLAVRVIPISRRLGRMLVRMLREPFEKTRLCFLNSRGTPWKGNALRLAFKRARDRCGLESDLRGENLVAYTLRHTGGTEAVRAGVRDFRLAELMGHSSTRTTQRYVHLCPQDAIDAAQAIEAARRRPRIQVSENPSPAGVIDGRKPGLA